MGTREGEQGVNRPLRRQLSRFIAVSPFAGFVERQFDCWCASQRQLASAAGAELDYVTAASFAYPALHKGEGLGEYEITYVPMHHILPRCLNRTAPHLVLQCNLQMSGTGLGPSAATLSKMPKRKNQDWSALKKENLRNNVMQPHVRLKARIGLPALKTQVSAFSTFA